MSARIAILTPDPADRDFHSRWRGVFPENAAPLERAGLRVEGRAWVDSADFGEFDLVLPLLTWGYHRADEAWQAAVGEWERRGIRLQNPASVLKWGRSNT